MKKKRSSFAEKVAELDMFSTKIALTFQGKPTFSTDAGAMMSIVCIICIGAYAITGIFQVAQNKMLSFSSSTTFMNTDVPGNSGLNPTDYGF